MYYPQFIPMPKCFVISILISLFFLQCHTANGLRRPTERLSLNKDGAAANKIVFLTYKVTYDTTKQEYTFKLTNKVFADGQLNPNMLSEQPYIEPGYFYCEITGFAQTQYNKVEDPLNIIREYPSEDATGKLTKVEIHQSEGEITLRFQYSPDVKSLLIKKPFPHSQKFKTIYYAKI
jgi:hypothetical protein